jgi:hypothetical protein
MFTMYQSLGTWNKQYEPVSKCKRQVSSAVLITKYIRDCMWYVRWFVDGISVSFNAFVGTLVPILNVHITVVGLFDLQNNIVDGIDRITLMTWQRLSCGLYMYVCVCARASACVRTCGACVLFKYPNRYDQMQCVHPANWIFTIWPCVQV